LISSAVAEKLTALLTEDYLEARAAQGSRKKFAAALRTVPDVEPEEFDRLPSSHDSVPQGRGRDEVAGRKRRGSTQRGV
jgi:hypothetical protein